jgi:hypothetical protein
MVDIIFFFLSRTHNALLAWPGTTGRGL